MTLYALGCHGRSVGFMEDVQYMYVNLRKSQFGDSFSDLHAPVREWSPWVMLGYSGYIYARVATPVDLIILLFLFFLFCLLSY